jgi:hypothetical protein
MTMENPISTHPTRKGVAFSIPQIKRGLITTVLIFGKGVRHNSKRIFTIFWGKFQRAHDGFVRHQGVDAE